MRVSSIFTVLLGLSITLAGSQSFAQSPPAPPVLISNSQPQCSDGIDNDGDGKIDFHATIESGDDGCWDPSDNDERVGVPAGTSLATSGECASSTLSSAGNTYNNCNWPNGVSIAAENVTIVNSLIGGSVSNARSTTVIQDSTIECGDNLAATNSPDGAMRLTRVRIRLCPQGFYTPSGTFEDGVIYDQYGDSSDCHLEPVLLHGAGGNTVVQRSRFRANLHSSARCSNGQGHTGVFVIHAAPGFWGPATDKLIQYNRIESPNNGPVYCAYGGGADSGTRNIRWEHNVWANAWCSQTSPWKIMLNYARGRSGSTWIGNVRGNDLATGAPLPEP